MKNILICLALILAERVPAAVLSEPRLLTNGFQFLLQSEPNDAFLIERSRDLTNWTPVAISTVRQSTRTVVAPGSATNSMHVYRARLLRGYGIRVTSWFDLRGFEFESDSFDSSDPAYSTAGYYDPAKRLDGGDVAAYSVVTNVSIAQIRGKLWMGLNGKTHGSIGGLSVGSGAWVDAGRLGVQPGYLVTNLAATLTEAPPPPPGGLLHSRRGAWLVVSIMIISSALQARAPYRTASMGPSS